MLTAYADCFPVRDRTLSRTGVRFRTLGPSLIGHVLEVSIPNLETERDTAPVRACAIPPVSR